ncbi:MAG: hypothetical protein Q7V57_06905 [Actinomycetota bacterium]|nr:hypothetical protein [Actinomycetota bacterium]
MTITTTGLTRAAGLSAAAAGLIFIAVQINHPPMDVTSVATTEWLVRNAAKVLMGALALVGITGMYLRQVRQVGVPGLIGYLLFGVGYLLMFATEVISAYVLPGLVNLAPGYVNDLLGAAAGGSTTGDIGSMKTVLAVTGVGYMVGGLIFGITLFRARILARWAAALLAVGTIATASLAVLPEAFNRPMAVPVGVALIGLGLSLWRNPRSDSADTATKSTRFEHATV